MKKAAKKLTLAKDTLAGLEGTLDKVAGGATSLCEWSGYATCGSCRATCGTNLC